MFLFDEEVLAPYRKKVHQDWESVAEREKRSRNHVCPGNDKG